MSINTTAVLRSSYFAFIFSLFICESSIDIFRIITCSFVSQMTHWQQETQLLKHRTFNVNDLDNFTTPLI